jgi:DNA-binding protein HU-beta
MKASVTCCWMISVLQTTPLCQVSADLAQPRKSGAIPFSSCLHMLWFVYAGWVKTRIELINLNERVKIMAVGKTELIQHVAAESGLTQVDAKKAVEAFLGCVSQTLKKGDEVRLTGFGSFAVQLSAARTGRNPRTGETIQIAASKRPVFKAGKELKDTVNG